MTSRTSADSRFDNGAPEEPALADGLRAGSEDAYEALISRYQQPVFNLVYRLLEDPGDASDVVQEVFLKVFRNVGSFRGTSSLRTWIYRIAVNEAHNHRRWFTRHRRNQVGLETEDDSARHWQEVLSDHSRSAFDLVSDAETRAIVEQALADVNPAFRAAVVLRDLEDMSYEEIAEVLQVSLGTVKSRILRGREALRRNLEGRVALGSGLEWAAQPAE